MKKHLGVIFLLTSLLSITLTAFLIQNPKKINVGFGALPGDCDDDNLVNILDFQLLSNSFGKSVGQTGYDPRCDFNSDNLINILDFQILSNNFGRTGTPTPSTLTPTPGGLVKITYTPINDDIRNPERGFYSQANVFVDKPLDPGKISTKQSTDSLVWIYFHLENYRDPRDGAGVTLTNYQGRPLEPLGSGKGLDTINNAFLEARKKGLKLVIRFLYIGYSGIGSNSNPTTAQPDAPLSLVEEHINQLSPLFNQNKDVIAAFQFGFVGYWGEWHSSKYLYSLEARRAVMNAMLSATPKDRMIQVRYPRYKQAFFGGPLTDTNAFNQSDLARIGLHDDAFLKDDTDDGTFKSTAGGTKVTTYCDNYQGGETACWRDYVKRDSTFVAVSGEAGTHSSTPSTLQMCPNALTQLTNMHFNSIHNGYSMVTLNAWLSGGCMPEIRRRLGYRIELKEVNLTKSVNRGEILHINGSLKNVGFGNLYNPRPIYLVLLGTQRYEFPLSIDPRRWEAGTEATFDANLTIPTSTQAGTYKLALWLPDSSTVLKGNPLYSIRFANQGTWDSQLGLNVLLNDFVVH